MANFEQAKIGAQKLENKLVLNLGVAFVTVIGLLLSTKTHDAGMQ